MASKISTALLSALMLAFFLSSSSEALVCKKYPISDMSCPSVEECVDRCHDNGYPLGLCLTISDELICMCSICHDGAEAAKADQGTVLPALEKKTGA
ncbi:hypothetical protein GUJ93_ZPchr0006g43466 [Zizania palustris]|uniref:Knottin scorpion toxin-like domain-containing protein n=1 Tax=Zizania palustris TaxID=103762 RepID=A0A8J5SLW3_ZIZPA|nr:hypothetical protein GUJ93_ZPchr0006g43466 [Zizania palustris]